MSIDFTPNDGEYLFLSGPDDAPIFLFIHGYGSASQDLIPLALYINSQGYNCAVLLLHGHGKEAEDIVGLTYSDWINQSRDFYVHYKSSFKKIYMVGFSLGATLSLHIAKEEKVAGVVAISTFLEPPKFTRIMLSIAKRVGLKYIIRLLQVTHKKTKKEIVYSKYLPVEETSNLIEAVSKLAPSLANVKCPVLFFHSTDDRVSDYWSTATLVEGLASCGASLVTFRCLRHFLHFDAPLSSWFRVIADFFWPNSSATNPQNSDLMKDAWSHASAELRHWSGILFQLIVGFFSIFGALIYFSLRDMLNNESETPYFLMSYSILSSLFLILLALYFFYVNRVNVFLKHHIEPYVSCISWTAYRTSKVFGGRESEKITRQLVFAVILIPFAISIVSVAYALWEYGDKILAFKSGNIMLRLTMGIAVILILVAIHSLQMLYKYTKRELYKIPVTNKSFSHIQEAVQSLYLSVSPGTVFQAKDDKHGTTG